MPMLLVGGGESWSFFFNGFPRREALFSEKTEGLRRVGVIEKLSLVALFFVGREQGEGIALLSAVLLLCTPC